MIATKFSKAYSGKQNTQFVWGKMEVHKGSPQINVAAKTHRASWLSLQETKAYRRDYRQSCVCVRFAGSELAAVGRAHWVRSGRGYHGD
jgi:hypothetical protein